MAGYAYIDPQECAEGIWWCPSCACAREFDVALGHRRGDDNAPLECLTCNHQIGFAVDSVQTYPYPPVETRRPTLTSKERAEGRERLRVQMFGKLLPTVAEAAKQAPPADLDAAIRDEVANIRRRA